MIITEIQYFSSKIIRFQAIFKDTVEFTCALEFKISSQLYILSEHIFTAHRYHIVPFCLYPNSNINASKGKWDYHTCCQK